MQNKTQWIALIVLIIIVIVASFISDHFYPSTAPSPYAQNQQSSGTGSGENFLASANYTCDSGKSIQAAFYDNPSLASIATSTSSSTPPTPTGSAVVALSDGRTFALNQTLSADGARYANSDESFVFWSKGNDALVLENGQMSTDYTNCHTTTE